MYVKNAVIIVIVTLRRLNLMNQDEKIILNDSEVQELLALLEECKKALDEADAIFAELDAAEAQPHSVIETPATRQMYFQDEEDEAELLPSYKNPDHPRKKRAHKESVGSSLPSDAKAKEPAPVEKLLANSTAKPETLLASEPATKTFTDALNEFALNGAKPNISPTQNHGTVLNFFDDDNKSIIEPPVPDTKHPPALLPELHFEPTKLITPDGALIYQDKVQTSKLKVPASQTPSALAKHDDFKPIRRNQKGPKVLHVKQEKRTKVQRNKSEEIQYINELQDMYVDRLAEIIADAKQDTLKETNFTSPTGTGKTKMMSKLINKHPEWFFLVTTPSYAQLHVQISANLHKDCPGDNYCVYGVSSLTANSILQDEDILELLPEDKKIVWIRDEGHRKSNNWMHILENRCHKIVNLSATNINHDGVVCNFADTMMLRTVEQQQGTIEDALNQLLVIKQAHANVSQYNPCALFRVVSEKCVRNIEEQCQKMNLRCLSLVNFDDYDMSELCKDDNDADVLIYKQKLDMGVDIRRAHIIFIENHPNNPSTIIQSIGRARRNALFWRQDIDILAPENEELLAMTRKCYVYFGAQDLSVETDENGELCNAFCPYISIQKLRPESVVYVKNGMMSNGLYIAELPYCTGEYYITTDENTGFNIVNNESFYATRIMGSYHFDNYNHQRLELLRKTWNQTILAQKISEVLPAEQREIKSRPNCSWTGHMQLEIWNWSSWQWETKEFVIPSQCFEYWVHQHEWFSKKRKHLRPIAPEMAYHILIGKSKEHKIESLRTYSTEDDPMIIINQSFYAQCELEKMVQIKDLMPGELSPLLSKIHSLHNYKYKDTAYEPHSFIYNNHELAMVGSEYYIYRKEIGWVPNTSVTSALQGNTKLRRLLVEKYRHVLDAVRPLLFTGRNDFNFPRRQNACLGFCVEYYAKSLLYYNFFKTNFPNTVEGQAKRLRACIDEYKRMMMRTYGAKAARLVVSPSADTIQSAEYNQWRKTCVKLARQTQKALQPFVKSFSIKYSPSFVTTHLAGLADIVEHDTIIDVKVTNHIDIDMILQVLAYHYLSLLRDDLAIDRVMVYDATSNTAIIITGLKTGDIHAEKRCFNESIQHVE